MPIRLKQASGCEVSAHDVGDDTDPLLLVEDRFPSWHFAKTVGHTVIHKFRLVAGGFELRCFARVGAVAVAVSALAVPDLFAGVNIGGVLQHGGCERRDRFIR